VCTALQYAVWYRLLLLLLPLLLLGVVAVAGDVAAAGGSPTDYQLPPCLVL
jgi:hypothetical protein